MKENYNDFSEDNHAPLPIKTDNTQLEICSFIEANVDKNNVAEVAEDIDENPAPPPDYIKNNNDKEAALPQNVSALKNVLDKSRKKLSEIQKKLVEKLHDDAKILQVNDNNGNSASVYLQFDEKYGDNAKIKNAINEAIEYAKNNKQNFEINPEYLPYIKSIFVDRKSVEKYTQGGGDDEVLLNGGFNNRELKSLKFYQKHTKHPGKGEYNMIMVAEYEISGRTQYCIIDMDNNLMISNDQLKLYCHGMDNFENNGFDDGERKVYESGLK